MRAFWLLLHFCIQFYFFKPDVLLAQSSLSPTMEIRVHFFVVPCFVSLCVCVGLQMFTYIYMCECVRVWGGWYMYTFMRAFWFLSHFCNSILHCQAQSSLSPTKFLYLSFISLSYLPCVAQCTFSNSFKTFIYFLHNFCAMSFQALCDANSPQLPILLLMSSEKRSVSWFYFSKLLHLLGLF